MKPADITFWHACRRNDLPSILENGLLPAASRSKSLAIYLANDRFTAENYANSDPGTDWVVLEIRGGDLNAEALGVDDYEFPELLQELDEERRAELEVPDLPWSKMDWATSLRVCNQVTYWQPISPTSVTVHELEFGHAAEKTISPQ